MSSPSYRRTGELTQPHWRTDGDLRRTGEVVEVGVPRPLRADEQSTRSRPRLQGLPDGLAGMKSIQRPLDRVGVSNHSHSRHLGAHHSLGRVRQFLAGDGAHGASAVDVAVRAHPVVEAAHLRRDGTRGKP